LDDLEFSEQIHFIVENEALAKALVYLKGVVRTGTTVPILTHVAVETAGDKEILVRANNFDRETEVRMPAEVMKAGAAALPGEVLQALAKRLTRGGQCEVSLVDDRAYLVAGSSKYDLRTLPIADFPGKKSASEPVEFSLSAAELRAMIKSVAYAASYPKSDRYYLQGVNLHVSGEKLIAVATDGVRLAVKSSPLPDGAAGMPRVTVPSETASAMADLLKDVEGDVELAVCPHLIELRLPDLRLASSLIDGTFPDYQRIMPAINGAAATFRVCALAEAVARVDIVRLSDVNKRAPILRLTTRMARSASRLAPPAASRRSRPSRPKRTGVPSRSASSPTIWRRCWTRGPGMPSLACSRALRRARSCSWPTSGRARAT
jgi:DNA polymerase-3 subunit beta